MARLMPEGGEIVRFIDDFSLKFTECQPENFSLVLADEIGRHNKATSRVLLSSPPRRFQLMSAEI
jgi:hypothetical protein